MDLTNKKLWGSLSLDGITQAKGQVPKRFKQSDKYGKQMTFDARAWEDGNITLSIWDAEKQERIYIGTIRLSNDQSGGGSPAAAGNQPSVADSTPFDSPF